MSNFFVTPQVSWPDSILEQVIFLHLVHFQADAPSGLIFEGFSEIPIGTMKILIVTIKRQPENGGFEVPCWSSIDADGQ